MSRTYRQRSHGKRGVPGPRITRPAEHRFACLCSECRLYREQVRNHDVDPSDVYQITAKPRTQGIRA